MDIDFITFLVWVKFSSLKNNQQFKNITIVDSDNDYDPPF